ncbi:MAG: virginiamycin B lyase family protein [Candidatus Bathyarchaeia archaeon]
MKRKGGVAAACMAMILLALFLKALPIRGALYEYWKVPGLSSPYDLTMDEDGNVWFTEYRSGEIGVFDPRGGVFKEYSISSTGRPQGIAYDGRYVWYVDSYRSVVGYTRATSPTTFTELKLPIDLEPMDIAPYNSTIVYLTLPRNQSVALINVSDTDKPLRIFSLPKRGTLNPAPRSIIFMEGSGCWYTDDGRGIIGQIPLTYSSRATIIVDHIREWHLSEGRKPWDIAADTYGRIWYTDPSNGLIGMLNPAKNEIVEFKVPGSGSVPYGIAVDDANQVWFTDRVRGSLWRYDQETGTFTEFNLQDSVTLQFITPSYSGPGKVREISGGRGPPVYGRAPLWLTDHDGDLLIRFDPRVAKTTIYVTRLTQAPPTTSYTKRFDAPAIEPKMDEINRGDEQKSPSQEEVKSVAYSVTETVSMVRTSTLHTETVTETEVFTVNSTTTAVTTVAGSTVTGGTTTIMMTETHTSYITTINRTIVLTSVLTTWNATSQAVPWGSPLHIGLGLAFGCLILALAARHRSKWREPMRVRPSKT